MDTELIVRGARVVTPDGVRPAAVHLRNGIIAAVTHIDETPVGVPVFDAGESVVMPGLVDSHVHINEPGRTDWEGFESATRAAAAGGVTTLVEMPLNSIPATTNVAALEAKLAAAREKCFVDVGFWGGAVPGNAVEFRSLHDAGVLGFKCFLVDSGVPEFAAIGERDFRIAMKELAALGSLLQVHAELPGPIERAASVARGDPGRYWTFLRARPRIAEDAAIDLVIKACRDTRARAHIVHLSSSDSLPQLRRAREEGLPLTVETCPHYLWFAAEEIQEGATQYKCCPPIRERENCQKLWSALEEGLIDMVVSDHSPCPPGMKLKETGNFLKAWGGISSLQIRLAIVWTAARTRGLGLDRLAEWLCAAPARLAGLGARKGAIRRGCDADLVVWNPEAVFRVEAANLHHKHKLTPYESAELHGVVAATFLRGRMIYCGGRFDGEPIGEMLLRGRA
jgi:allantoinase